jgi:threonyl-tRNA synthetase
MYKPDNFWVSLSVSDPAEPEKYLGDKTIWEQAENTLETVAKKLELPYKKVLGEAAFYGPKLDFMFYDALGRERQLATAQLDFVMPNRFGLEYTDQTGAKQSPVMIHRAIAGSLERFMAIMIEHFAGEFPLWLSPIQLAIIPVNESHIEYAKSVQNTLIENGFRTKLDTSNESMGKKIRQAKNLKLPYFIVLGDKEMSDNNLTLESRSQKENTTIELSELIAKLKSEL